MSSPSVLQNQPWTSADHKRTRRAAIAGSVGSFIEYYDLSLYGYVAIVIAPQFFPNANPVVSLLAALVVFATAYLMRPLGGIFFGYIGDRYGRKSALVSTLVCMGIGSVLLGILPTHAQFGVGATVLLVLVRIVQGFSAGGEVGGAVTFVSESSPGRLRGTYGAYTPFGSIMGFAVASGAAGLMSGVTTNAQFAAWGWRVPFLLALPLMIICLWLRSRIEETSVTTGAPPAHAPLLTVFRHHPIALLNSTLFSIACTGTAYVCLSYMTIHLVQRLGYDRTTVYWVTTVVVAISALAMLPAGRLADRIGHLRMTMWGLVGAVVLSYPAMAVMHINIVVAAIAFALLILTTSMIQTGTYIVLPLLFKKEVRFSGVAMGWNLGVVIAGGTAPVVSVWLVQQTGNLQSPAIFMIVSALIGMIGVWGIHRKWQLAKIDGRTELQDS